MSAWMWPTVRSISWAPLAGVAACLGGFVALVTDDQLTSSITGIAAATVAAAVVAGTHDPAADLLAASPTSALVRLLRRLLFLGPAGLGVWVATSGGALLGLLVLAVVGVAVSTRAGVTAGVVVPLAWTVLAWATGLDWELR